MYSIPSMCVHLFEAYLCVHVMLYMFTMQQVNSVCTDDENDDDDDDDDDEAIDDNWEN